MLQNVPNYKSKIPVRGWLRGFERRYRHRLSKVKTSTLGHDRASKATAAVRDACYAKFTAMLASLVADGRLTQDQIDNHLGDMIMNADEIGGNEKGKRKPVYAPAKKKQRRRSNDKKNKWRNVVVGHDNNPFHVSTMLLTFGNGVVSNAVGILHSSPGNPNPRSIPEHKEGLHPEWFQYTTTNGSMTRASFEAWCRYIVEYFTAKGKCTREHPLILLIDGHTSRWTHAGLMHLNDNCIYPFCIASHTSAWAQANDCGINAKDKSYFGVQKRRWCTEHPFFPFSRKQWNECKRQSLAKLQVVLMYVRVCWVPSHTHAHIHKQVDTHTHTHTQTQTHTHTQRHTYRHNT